MLVLIIYLMSLLLQVEPSTTQLAEPESCVNEQPAAQKSEL